MYVCVFVHVYFKVEGTVLRMESYIPLKSSATEVHSIAPLLHNFFKNVCET